MSKGSMAVVLSLPYLSEFLTNQALTEDAINNNDTLIVKSVQWNEENKCYIADCDIFKETIH